MEHLLNTELLKQIIRDEVDSRVDAKLKEITAELNSIKKSGIPAKSVLTVDEAAVYMGRARRSILTFIREGKLPSYKNGKRRFLKTEDINAFLLKRRSMSVDEIEYETAKNLYTRTMKKKEKIAG